MSEDRDDFLFLMQVIEELAIRNLVIRSDHDKYEKAINRARLAGLTPVDCADTIAVRYHEVISKLNSEK